MDLDVTDDLIHGKQEGRFFHGYYGNYCYLPLYIFCREFLLCARLRSAEDVKQRGGRRYAKFGLEDLLNYPGES